MKRGISLMEVLLALSLTSLVLVVAFRLATQFLRLYRTESLKTDLQQSVLISLSRLASDLQQTVPSGVSVSESTPVALAVNPFVVQAGGQVVDGSGRLTWDDRFFVVAWLPGVDELVRFEHRPGVAPYLTPVRAKKLPPANLRDVITNSLPARRQVLARQVVSFAIEPVGCELELRQPLKFTLEARREQLRFRLSRSVFLAGSR